MGNTAKQSFTGNSTFVAPAGVKSVTVIASRNPYSVNFKGSSQGGDDCSLFMDAYGGLWGCGIGGGGQLGNNSTANFSSPTAVVGGLAFRLFTRGSSSGYGITTSDVLYSWGINGNGQLGDNSVTARSSPVAVVGGLLFQNVLAITDSGGASGCIGLTTTGKAYGWGSNVLGALGDGTITTRSSPVLVVGGLTFQSIHGTGFGTCFGITPAGAAYGWGYNNSGQVGDGTSAHKSSPVAVLGGLTFKKIVCPPGGFTTLGLTTSGALYGWGQNGQGQIGDGTTTFRSSPVAVIGGLTFSDIVFYSDDFANHNAFGITADGTAYAWGQNGTYGQLGVGDNVNRSSPTLVVGGLKFKKITVQSEAVAGGITVAALDTSGNAYTWGDSSQYVLGNGSITPTSSPVAVLGGLKFSDIEITRSCVKAVALSGLIYGWGNNSSGQLGDGTITSRSSPALIVGGIIGNINPIVSSINIPVTPGASYSIVTGPYYAYFGTQVLLKNSADVITVIYEQ